jgi:predicted PurR-regulated permease PerM
VQRPREPILSSPVVARAARVFVLAWAAVGIVILAYLVLRYVLYPVRVVFPPLLLALILVYLLNPPVTRLERRGMRRGWATLITYVVALVALGGLLVWLIPLVSHQVGEFSRSIPDLLHRAERGLLHFARRLGLRVRSANILGAFGKSGSVGEYIGRVTSVSSAVGLVLVLVLGPILAFYLLVDLPKMRRTLEAAVPARRRREVQHLAGRVSTAVGGYFRGQLLVAALIGAFCMLGFWFIGLPYWAPVGLIVGLFSLIPFIGPFLGAIPSLFVAFTTPRSASGGVLHPRPGWPLAVAASVVLLIIQQADALVVSPRLVSRSVRLHPVTVMLSLLVAGTIAGVWGMLLAIPTVAAAKILVVHYWDTRMVWPPRGSEEPSDRTGHAPGEAPDRFAEDPGPVMVAPLPDDEAAVGEAGGNGADAAEQRPVGGPSPGRLARASRQGRTSSGERRAAGPRRGQG